MTHVDAGCARVALSLVVVVVGLHRLQRVAHRYRNAALAARRFARGFGGPRPDHGVLPSSERRHSLRSPACLSTSASQEVAVAFAASALPLVFKFETKDFTSRGADASWLSVYPREKQAMYPPLTYLRSVKAENETLGGMTILVATVEPVFM